MIEFYKVENQKQIRNEERSQNKSVFEVLNTSFQESMNEEFESVSQEAANIVEQQESDNDLFLSDLMQILEKMNSNMTFAANLSQEVACILQNEALKYNDEKTAMEEELMQLNSLVHRSNVMMEIKNREQNKNTSSSINLKRRKGDL